MKIGLIFFPVRPQFLAPAARRADELGYESVWIPEHLLFPTKIESKYPYDPTLGPPLPSTPLFDPLITLSYVAAQTKRIRLGTGIYILPLRHPVLVAKYIATLDALSEGRVVLSVGAGWLKEEFDAIEAPFDKRGSRMEEGIQIMRRLWTEQRIAHQGRFYRFEETGFEPKPPRGCVPILIGGESSMALKRAARFGDGWQGLDHMPEAAAPFIKELLALRGENQAPFEITIGHPSVPSLDDLRRYRDVGVDRVTTKVRFLGGGGKTIEATLDGLQRFAETVMGRLEA